MEIISILFFNNIRRHQLVLVTSRKGFSQVLPKVIASKFALRNTIFFLYLTTSWLVIFFKMPFNCVNSLSVAAKHRHIRSRFCITCKQMV